MYLEHWGLNDYPFENVANQSYFFQSNYHQGILDDIEDAVKRRKGAVMLSGDIGCGKSTLIQRVLLALPANRFDVVLITHASLTPVEMLLEICYQLQLDTKQQDKPYLLRILKEHLIRSVESGKDTVVCIDEAQSIASIDTLEELRLLLNFQLGNRFLLTLILVGQPELQESILSLPQLSQRIALNLKLGHLNAENTIRYILHRLNVAGATRPILTKQAVESVFEATEGTPRRVNHLLDRCLLLGMRQGSSVIDKNLVLATLKRYPC